MKFGRHHQALVALTLAIALHGGAATAADKVHVGIVNASTDVPFFIADAKGYFKEEGLSVELTPFDSASKMTAPLGTGELDAGGGAISIALYNAVEHGIQLKIVADKAHYAPGYGYVSLLIRKDLVASGKFKGYKDLKGLRVARVGIGTTDEAALNQALKLGGLHWGDVELVSLGFPQHPVAFQNGAIDASITNEPTRTYILKAGTAVRFVDIQDFYPRQQVTTLLYGAPFAKNRPDTAKKFMRAYIKAARFYNGALAHGRLAGPNADEVIAILVKYAMIKDAALYRAITPQAIDPDGRLNVESMKRDWQFFKDTKQIDGKVTVNDVVDTSFARAAVAALGPYRGGAGH